MNLIRASWLKTAHELIDRLGGGRPEAATLRQAVSKTTRLDRRQLLRYMGVGLVAASSPKIFLPPAQSQVVGSVTAGGVWHIGPDNFQALGEVLAFEIRKSVQREGFTRRILPAGVRDGGDIYGSGVVDRGLAPG